MELVSLGPDLLALVIAIVVSYVLALPVGWERKEGSEAEFGLRVFPLVSVGACVYAFLGQQLFVGDESVEQADILQGLMTGIGFVGAGAIIKNEDEVRGLATAAAIWTTGAIGASVAYGAYALAIGLSLLDVFTLAIMRKLGKRVMRATETGKAEEERADA
jgi:putative Mg2+ transporter-C (MgtC) family protein